MAWPKRLIKIGGIVIVILMLAGSFLLGILLKNQFSLESVDVVIKQQRIRAEVVSSPAALYRGLSGRAELCRDCGLLFNFSGSAEREFVMRDMRFPLDIIFINGGQIINIAANLEPEGNNPQHIYRSTGPVNQVLEVNSGSAERLGFKIGDRVLTQKIKEK